MKSEGVANLPASVNASLAELRGIVTDLRTGGAVDNVNATLASVRAIADQATRTQLVAKLTDVLADDQGRARAASDTAIDGVPAVVAQIDALTRPRPTPFRSTSSSPRRRSSSTASTPS